LLRSGWFRSALLWLSIGLGCIWYLLRRGWMALLLIAVIAGLWFADKIHLFSLLGGPWLQWWKILLFYFLVLILWSGMKLRRRVVVEEFVDYTMPEKPGLLGQSGENKTNDANKPQSMAKGLATLLVVKLAQVREMYQAGSTLEQRPIQTDVGQVQSVEASTIDDVRGLLNNAVSAESQLTLGFLQIPVGTIIALFARIFQGPRIIGVYEKVVGSQATSRECCSQNAS
jgi:hypothetical protein